MGKSTDIEQLTKAKKKAKPGAYFRLDLGKKVSYREFGDAVCKEKSTLAKKISFALKSKRTVYGASSGKWKATYFVKKQEELGETKESKSGKVVKKKSRKKKGVIASQVKLKDKFKSELAKIGMNDEDIQKAKRPKQPKRLQIFFEMVTEKGKPIIPAIKVAQTGECVNKCAALKDPKVLRMAEPGPSGRGVERRKAIRQFAKMAGCKCCDYQIFLPDGK